MIIFIAFRQLISTRMIFFSFTVIFRGYLPSSPYNIKFGVEVFKLSIKLRLTDQFKQKWHSALQISPKALSYRLFMVEFRFEKYLDVLNDKNRFTFCRFRTSNHRLLIEVGHWGVMVFFQGELIFLFIISISLHNLRIVSGFFLLNNDDSFNAFGLLKKYYNLDN
jgi:hypothetical protein